MIKFKQFFIFTLFLLEFSFSIDIPINSVQRGDIAEWLFMGPIKQGSEASSLISKIEKDPSIYFSSEELLTTLNVKNINSEIIFGGQFYYQLYDKLSKGDIIFAYAYIESKKDQNVIFDNNSARGNIEIYLNGSFVVDVKNKREKTKVKLKKGLNDVLLKIYPDNYSLDLTALYHRFFFSILPEERFEINGVINDREGNPIPFANVTAWDNAFFYNETSMKMVNIILNFFLYQKAIKLVPVITILTLIAH